MKQCSQTLAEIQSGMTESLDHNNKFTTRPSLTTVWVQFGYRGNGGNPAEYGWKAHIGFDDSTSENLELAWNTLLPILKEYQIGSGKIVKDGRNLINNDSLQCGKQAAIYCFKQSPAIDWAQFFAKITHEFRRAGIKCAPLSLSDFKLPGSEYISYRDDNGNGNDESPSLPSNS